MSACFIFAALLGMDVAIRGLPAAAQPVGETAGQPLGLRFPSATVPATSFAASRRAEQEPPALLTARLYRPANPGAPGPSSTPALVVLPGCVGQMEPAVEMQLAARFLSAGIAVLLVESLPSRHLHPQCLWDDGQADRLADAIGALDALATQPGIDPDRIAVLGIGRSGNAALAAIAADGYPGRLSKHSFAAAIAYYPRCAPVHADLAAPGLIVIGAADATSPVAWCRFLPHRVLAVGPGPPQYLEIPGAGHGFDLAGASDPAGRPWGQPDPVYMEEADAAAHTAVIRFLLHAFGR